MIKILKPNYDNEDEYTEALDDFLDIKLTSGKKLNKFFPNTKVLIQSSCPPADYFDSGTMFIASEELKTIIESFSVKAEFFNIEVIFEGKSYEKTNFYFVNLLDEVDCIDYKNSIYDMDGSYVDKIDKLVIDEKKCNKKYLFRISNTFENIICLSEILVNKLIESNITGVKFISPSEWEF